MNLRDVTFLIVDLETTGANPHFGAGITEIGAVKVRGGQLLGEFQTFVNPLTPIPPFITELTGITAEMLKFAPVIDEALPDFLAFAGSPNETALVAHNAPFDTSFLKAAAKEIEVEWPAFPTIDTVRLAQSTLGRDEVPNCKLGTLAHFFGTEVTPTHRALDDAKTTVEIMHRLFERIAGFGVENFGELQKLLAKRIKREPRLM
jgi:DNA polymerase III epsilon subunit family exonuclease